MCKTDQDEKLYKFVYLRFGKSDADDNDDVQVNESIDDEYVDDEPMNQLTNLSLMNLLTNLSLINQLMNISLINQLMNISLMNLLMNLSLIRIAEFAKQMNLLQIQNSRIRERYTIIMESMLRQYQLDMKLR